MCSPTSYKQSCCNACIAWWSYCQCNMILWSNAYKCQWDEECFTSTSWCIQKKKKESTLLCCNWYIDLIIYISLISSKQIFIMSNKSNKEVISNCCSRWTSLLMISVAGWFRAGRSKWMSSMFKIRIQIYSIIINASLYISAEISILGFRLVILIWCKIFSVIESLYLFRRADASDGKHVVNIIKNNWRICCEDELSTASASVRSQWLSSSNKCNSLHASK